MLTDKDVDHIAALARIQLSSEEHTRLKKDLGSILTYVETLNAVDTSGVDPLYQTTGLLNSVRSDQTRNEFPLSHQRDALLIEQAPDHDGRFIKVKPILTKK
ncbi:MAG TPA: Asp-tRNA(Asn)/Glu-tRNA(Gln) amidotransferase subunit GatC [Candidatus Paceibacterota bacterium]|nr:Asp-tRNA(Asn)/Glu-tRNA(Gln) amidotransferase subunit GatC [Candidatus Paceibacterota bacterium]